MNRALIHELATGRFIAQREDALFLGPPGTGKSHLAQAIGRAVIQQGYRVLYREAHTLLEELADATLDGTRKAYLADLAAVPLLIIDDLGMRKLPHTAAEDLLEIIMRRYERASTLLTSNRPVDDWGKLLGDTAAVTALLDRLLHHAHVLKCGPRSWRTKVQTDLRTEDADEVELTGLGRPAEIAGFALSINCRFSAVHRGRVRIFTDKAVSASVAHVLPIAPCHDQAFSAHNATAIGVVPARASTSGRSTATNSDCSAAVSTCPRRLFERGPLGIALATRSKESQRISWLVISAWSSRWISLNPAHCAKCRRSRSSKFIMGSSRSAAAERKASSPTCLRSPRPGRDIEAVEDVIRLRHLKAVDRLED